MKKFLTRAGVAAILLAGLGGILTAEAQIPSPPALQSLNQSDLVPVIPRGVGGVPSQYASPGFVGGMLSEQLVVPLTAFTITPNNNTTLLFLNPAGTLATGTITFAAAPSDAQEFCWTSSQTQTAVTMTANTGQSIVGTGVTAGVAGTEYCWRYISATATWYRTQ